MEPCTINSWDMNIFMDPSGAQIARPLFRNVKVENGRITAGDVHLPIGHIVSALRGTCTPFPDLGMPGVSVVTFMFRLKDASGEIGIFFTGLAFTKSGNLKASFEGRWIAYPPSATTPSSNELVTLVLPGSGDTGTGTGSQT